jgi:uncharacterized protein (DUF1778 family)
LMRRNPMPPLAEKSHSPSRGHKGDRIEARLATEIKAVIEHAARLVGISASEFVVLHSHEAARAVISEHERWSLDRQQSIAFVEAIIIPPEPNDALRKAADIVPRSRDRVPRRGVTDGSVSTTSG